jgi:transcriptional regulator with XRE-family HTH domain
MATQHTKTIKTKKSRKRYRYTDNWLRFYREERGWSIGQLAKKARISKVFLTNVERERSNPSERTMEDLAAALKVELEDLFPDDGRRTPKQVLRLWQEDKGRSA